MIDEPALSKLLQTLAHDLRGSLGANATFAKMLTEEYADVLDERALRWLCLMSNEYAKSQQKLDGLNEYARFFNYQPRFETCDVKNMLNECLSDKSLQNISILACHLDNCNGVEIVSDPELLSMVFLELFKNTLRHAKPANESGSLECDIAYTNVNHQHSISYVDNGTAIDGKDIDFILLPFKAVKKASHDLVNCGLGLSKVKQIVRVLNGKIEFSLGRKSFKGLQVTITLPI